MSYTAAHPIAVIPIWYLSRKKLPLAAMIIGSMSPDFPYLYHLRPVIAPGHTATGLFTHCLPYSAILVLIWYLWVRRPILQLLNIAGDPRPKWTLQFVVLALTGILIGAVTHNVWDSTSHPWGWSVEHFELFRRKLGPLPVYKWIQYGGGVGGLIALLLWFRFGVQRNQKFHSREHKIALWIFAISNLNFVALANWLHASSSLYEFLMHSAVAVISGSFFAAFVYATIDNSRSALRNHSFFQ